MNEEKEQEAKSLEQYLRAIECMAPCTQEEEVQLVQQMACGKAERDHTVADRRIIQEGEQAQRRLTEAHLRLVVSIAKSYNGLDRSRECRPGACG